MTRKAEMQEGKEGKRRRNREEARKAGGGRNELSFSTLPLITFSYEPFPLYFLLRPTTIFPGAKPLPSSLPPRFSVNGSGYPFLPFLRSLVSLSFMSPPPWVTLSPTRAFPRWKNALIRFRRSLPRWEKKGERKYESENKRNIIFRVAVFFDASIFDPRIQVPH